MTGSLLTAPIDPGLRDLGPRDTDAQLLLALAAGEAFDRRVSDMGPDFADRFLAHVASSVPHYRAMVADGARLVELEDFPVIDREVMLRDPRSFLSDRFPLEELDRDHYWIKTNGTLSDKFKVLLDPAAFYDLQHFSVATVLATVPGMLDRLFASDPAVPQVHLVSDAGGVGVLRNPALGGAAMRFAAIGQGLARDRDLLAVLHRGPVAALCGKPHVLVGLAALDERAGVGGPRVRPEVIVTSGETLYPSYRRRLSEAFGCRVIDGYTASEAGFIGFDCEHRTGIHVRTERVIVEIETAAGEILPEGDGHLIVTNLMNWAQPFVRYRLRDRACLIRAACPCGFEGPSVHVSGRDRVGYEVPGIGTVPASRLSAALDRLGVEHFQVAQEANGDLRIRWIRSAGASPRTGDALAAGLRVLVGGRFELVEVGAISVPGGKLLRFVSVPRSAAAGSDVPAGADNPNTRGTHEEELEQQ